MMPADAPDFGALRLRDLSTLGFAQGFTLWHYKALHLPLHRMLVPGFFDPAAGDRLMQRGDIILISANDGAGCVTVGPPAQGAHFTVSPINFPLFSEIACLNTPTPRPPARLRLAALLRRLVNPACWSR